MSDSDPPRDGPSTLSRRAFLTGAGGVAGGVAAGGLLRAAPLEGRPAPCAPGPPRLSGAVALKLRINGAERELVVEPRTSLLDALRVHLEEPLTGTKSVCDRGNCGACTVLVDGEPACSCLLLAVELEGRELTTVEGLAQDGRPSPVQRALCEADGLMCGFCTPGFAMSLTALLRRRPDAGLDEVREACAGNLCRCGTQPFVFQAALAAGAELGRSR